MTPDGKLRWHSAVYGYQDLPSHLPVSIHPDGTVYYVTINQTSILALSSQDGSLIKSYSQFNKEMFVVISIQFNNSNEKIKIIEMLHY